MEPWSKKPSKSSRRTAKTEAPLGMKQFSPPLSLWSRGPWTHPSSVCLLSDSLFQQLLALRPVCTGAFLNALKCQEEEGREKGGRREGRGEEGSRAEEREGRRGEIQTGNSQSAGHGLSKVSLSYLLKRKKNQIRRKHRVIRAEGGEARSEK